MSSYARNRSQRKQTPGRNVALLLILTGGVTTAAACDSGAEDCEETQSCIGGTDAGEGGDDGQGGSSGKGGSSGAGKGGSSGAGRGGSSGAGRGGSSGAGRGGSSGGGSSGT